MKKSEMTTKRVIDDGNCGVLRSMAGLGRYEEVRSMEMNTERQTRKE